MLLKSIYIFWIFSFANLMDGNSMTNMSPSSNKKLVFYTASLNDRRNFPMNKALLKRLYDVKIVVNNQEMISDFLYKVNQKYGLNKNNQDITDKIADTRIYIELFDKRKLQIEIEIFAGGRCLSINNVLYSTSQEFYDFLSIYIPKGENDMFMPLF